MTRARRHLAIVADSGTVSRDEFIKRLVEYVVCHGEVRSAVEYDEEQTVTASSEDVESMVCCRQPQ